MVVKKELAAIFQPHASSNFSAFLNQIFKQFLKSFVLFIFTWFSSVSLDSRSQTTEYTANVLMAAGYNCECRGPIPVKGKGILTTYFVKTPFDDKL